MLRNAVFPSLVAILVAACASAPQRDDKLASADCKIQPLAPASIGVRNRTGSSADQHYAEMQLATSDYRARQLRSSFGQTGIVEEALRDCRR